MTTKLEDIGERAIIARIMARYVSSPIGDDCAHVRVSDEGIVLTTDPVPIPAARLFGGDEDPYWIGWLLVTINASDIAAAGGEPLVFLAAIEAPADLDVTAFERLLSGIRDSCNFYGFAYVGGNLKEADRIHAVGTAVARVGAAGLRRTGARAGQVLVSIGRGGVFWRDVLFAQKGTYPSDRMNSPLFRPIAQVRAMRAARAMLSAAIDNSDGLLPSISQLADSSGVKIVLNLEDLHIDAPEGVDPARLWLGWGDWNVIVTADPGDVEHIRAAVSQEGSVALIIGSVHDGTGAWLSRNGRILPAPRLESERFARDSWFRTGPTEYLKRLLTVDLP